MAKDSGTPRAKVLILSKDRTTSRYFPRCQARLTGAVVIIGSPCHRDLKLVVDAVPSRKVQHQSEYMELRDQINTVPLCVPDESFRINDAADEFGT